MSILVSSVFMSSLGFAAPLTSDVELSSSNAPPKSYGTIYLADKLDKFPSYTVICTIQSNGKAKQNEDLFYIQPHLSFSVNDQVVNSVRGIGTLPVSGIAILKIPGVRDHDVHMIDVVNLDDTDTIQIRNCYASVEK